MRDLDSVRDSITELGTCIRLGILGVGLNITDKLEIVKVIAESLEQRQSRSCV